uniref:Uncharacterized protein n=1 Tax=Arundo donax TaxID=35708 RepID=A0A0A9H593_ARUDO
MRRSRGTATGCCRYCACSRGRRVTRTAVARTARWLMRARGTKAANGAWGAVPERTARKSVRWVTPRTSIRRRSRGCCGRCRSRRRSCTPRCPTSATSLTWSPGSSRSISRSITCSW